jgi:hypothetical protein
MWYGTKDSIVTPLFGLILKIHIFQEIMWCFVLQCLQNGMGLAILALEFSIKQQAKNTQHGILTQVRILLCQALAIG